VGEQSWPPAMDLILTAEQDDVTEGEGRCRGYRYPIPVAENQAFRTCSELCPAHQAEEQAECSGEIENVDDLANAMGGLHGAILPEPARSGWVDIGSFDWEAAGVAVTDEAILKIKEMITSGELKPGDRLPREPDLAARLGLARNSLREAVRALSLMQILDVRQGDGTYVTSLDPPLLLEALTFVVDFHQNDSVLNFLEVRRMIEPAAAALAASRIDAAQLEHLEQVLAAVDPNASADELVANDLEFHRCVARASGNPVLASVVEGLAAPTQRARIWRGLTEQGALERTLSEHRSIVQALAAGESETARSWMTVHIAGVEQWLRQVLVD
jgi:GntR family transcriptional regulator, transcriptional repressor for pyruvate dehydrogenase complex